jgi:hypothetical protein
MLNGLNETSQQVGRMISFGRTIMDNLAWFIIVSAVVAAAVGSAENAFAKVISYAAAVGCVVALYICVMDWRLGIDAVAVWRHHEHATGSGIPVYLGLCELTPWPVFIGFILGGFALFAACWNSDAQGVAILGHVSILGSLLYGTAKAMIVIGLVDPHLPSPL